MHLSVESANLKTLSESMFDSNICHTEITNSGLNQAHGLMKVIASAVSCSLPGADHVFMSVLDPFPKILVPQVDHMNLLL